MAKTQETYRIQIDKQLHVVDAPVITGLKLKELAGVDPQTYGVWLEVRGGEDRPVENTETVDLTTPGVERFFTGKKTTTEG